MPGTADFAESVKDSLPFQFRRNLFSAWQHKVSRHVDCAARASIWSCLAPQPLSFRFPLNSFADILRDLVDLGIGHPALEYCFSYISFFASFRVL